MIKKKVFVGVDVGTQGVRMVMVDEVGNVHFEGDRRFELYTEHRIKQNPDGWWRLLEEIFVEIQDNLSKRFHDEYVIEAIGVTSTSGTIIPLDKDDNVLYGAIMYSDPQSWSHSDTVQKCALNYYKSRLGFKNFSSSCGLTKMVWFKDQFKKQYDQDLRRFAHASDYITGKMTGIYDVTDHSNALKSGYDLHNNQWPGFIYQDLKISPSLLPSVKPIGSILGLLEKKWAEKWNFPNRPKVIVGLTDGCASQIAAGAVRPGDWNTTIGTTLVVKGVSLSEIYDKEGSIYCHKHPDGYWMPGGASNIGADWVNDFTKEEVEYGSRMEPSLEPSPLFFYPLKMKGERFPFVSPQARGFVIGYEGNRQALFQAGLEGVAFVERYAYEKIEILTKSSSEKVFSAGGANKNEKWLTIRANVLNKPIIRSDKANGAMGAAIVAASHMFERGIAESSEHLLGEMQSITPNASLVQKYEFRYQDFIKLLKTKGYIDE